MGLLLAASGPAPDDPAARVAGYFATHEQRSMVAHFLIDGLAGLAIIAIAGSLYRYLSGGERLRRLVLWAGLAAGAASLGQMIVGETLSFRAAHGASAESVKTLFTILNDSDTIKIALLALMIGSASLLARGGAFPRWLATAGLVFAPLLAVSGLAFPLGSDALYASLELTLIALLSWVAAVTFVVARRAPERDAVAPAAALS